MYQEEIEKRGQFIISIYKIIYKIVFKYGIFLIIIIGSIYWAKLILERETTIFTFTDNEAEQKTIKIKTFEKRLNTIKGSGDLVVFVWLWSLDQSWTSLASYNNLITYRGYTLPRYFAGDITMFTQTDFATSTTYSQGELEWFITKLRSIKNKDTIDNIKNRAIPITTDIETTFNLQCLSQSKIYNGLCQTFTDNFIKTFLLYNISADIEGFKRIFTILTASNSAKYKNALCKNLIYYSYYNEDTSNEIKTIMKSCSTEDYDAFNKFVLFSAIQKELENKFISSTIYTDNIINEYKMTSFLQILYEDINSNKINIDRINSYLDFVEELLKAEKLSLLETNIIYYFNNYKLKSAIENPELFMKLDNKTSINNVLKRINNVNNGNMLIGYKWLKYKVNESILVEKTEIGSWVQKEDYAATIDKLLGQISNISIDSKQISGNQILTKGSLQATIWDAVIKFPVKIWFQEQSSILYIKKIDIDGQTEFSTNINTIVAKQQRSVWDFQKYLNENTNLFNITTKDPNWEDVLVVPQSFCEKTKETLSGSAIIEKCDDSSILIRFKENWKEIGVAMNYENFIFQWIEVSNTEAKNKISEFLNKPEIITKYGMINEGNMATLLLDIVSLFDWKWIITGPTEFNASENTLIVLDRVKKYLGVKVTDIVEKGNKTALTFTLEWINFIGNYNIATHQIEQLYFKDIIINEIPALIKNVQFTLDDANIEEIKIFKKDPISYIKGKSIENYLLYIKNEPK